MSVLPTFTPATERLVKLPVPEQVNVAQVVLPEEFTLKTDPKVNPALDI